jgi:hypothetical protein
MATAGTPMIWRYLFGVCVHYAQIVIYCVNPKIHGDVNAV